MSENQVLQLGISLIGGGLAGSILTIIYNCINTKIKYTQRGKIIISALLGELNRSKLLCDYNAKQGNVSTATFIHYPSIAAIRATFEDRCAYKKLDPIIKNLEYYTLALLQLNELIDQYRLLFTIESKGSTGGPIFIFKDELRNKIASICLGETKIEGTGVDGFLEFPETINILIAKLN
jgi:hypothetical protein